MRLPSSSSIVCDSKAHTRAGWDVIARGTERERRGREGEREKKKRRLPHSPNAPPAMRAHPLLLLAGLLGAPPAHGAAFYGPRPANAPPPSRWATRITPDPAYEPLM